MQYQSKKEREIVIINIFKYIYTAEYVIYLCIIIYRNNFLFLDCVTFKFFTDSSVKRHRSRYFSVAIIASTSWSRRNIGKFVTCVGGFGKRFRRSPLRGGQL